MSFALANLPNVTALATALSTLEKDVGPVGFVILKMDKRGDWVFGANQTEVEPEALWAVNPASFVHGYIAWGDGEVLGEKMVPLIDPMPEVGPAPAGAEKGWQLQLGMSLKCLSGPTRTWRYATPSRQSAARKPCRSWALQSRSKLQKTKPSPCRSSN